MRLLHWNISGENLLSIDYNDSEIGELVTALGYHSHSSTSCHVYVSMYHCPWPIEKILFDRNEFVFKIISFDVFSKCTNLWHQLKDMTEVHFLSVTGLLGYTEL